MKPFTKLHAIATPFYRENVDTDLIIPAAHLKTITRAGLGKLCFETLRYDENGQLRNSSPFDHGAYKSAEILVGGPNFGCGSSREHAVWALIDMGYSCVIAPSFADIFFGNAAKNGLLLITLPEGQVRKLEAEATGQKFKVDLENQTISTDSGLEISFDIDVSRKERLLAGLDEIGQTLQEDESITAFENQDRQNRPWLYPS